MATPIEAEQYEVLETIGMCSAILLHTNLLKLTMCAGRGSFGTIRRVRRVSDGHVQGPHKLLQILRLLTLIRTRYYAGRKSNTSRCPKKSENNFTPSSQSSTPSNIPILSPTTTENTSNQRKSYTCIWNIVVGVT